MALHVRTRCIQETDLSLPLSFSLSFALQLFVQKAQVVQDYKTGAGKGVEGIRMFIHYLRQFYTMMS